MAGKVFFSVSMSLDGFIASDSLEELMERLRSESYRQFTCHLVRRSPTAPRIPPRPWGAPVVRRPGREANRRCLGVRRPFL